MFPPGGSHLKGGRRLIAAFLLPMGKQMKRGICQRTIQFLIITMEGIEDCLLSKIGNLQLSLASSDLKRHMYLYTHIYTYKYMYIHINMHTNTHTPPCLH